MSSIGMRKKGQYAGRHTPEGGDNGMRTDCLAQPSLFPGACLTGLGCNRKVYSNQVGTKPNDEQATKPRTTICSRRKPPSTAHTHERLPRDQWFGRTTTTICSQANTQMRARGAKRSPPRKASVATGPNRAADEETGAAAPRRKGRTRRGSTSTANQRRIAQRKGADRGPQESARTARRRLARA